MKFEQKIIFKQAFKTGLATAIASACYLYFKMPNGYWMVITAALIMQSDLEVAGFYSALRQGLGRLIGTVIGAAIGLPSLFLVQQHLWLGIPMVFLIMFFSTFVVEKSSGLKMVGATAIIVMLISAHYREPWDLALYRCSAILIGCTIAIVITALVFPYPADKILSQGLSKILRLQGSVFQVLMNYYTDQTTPALIIKDQIRSWQVIIEKNDRVMKEMRRADVAQKKHYNYFVENIKLLTIHIRRMYDAESYYGQNNMYFSSIQTILTQVNQALFLLFMDVSMALNNQVVVVDYQLAQTLIEQFDKAINQVRLDRMSAQNDIYRLEDSYHLLAFFHSIESIANLLFELCQSPLLSFNQKK